MCTAHLWVSCVALVIVQRIVAGLGMYEMKHSYSSYEVCRGQLLVSCRWSDSSQNWFRVILWRRHVAFPCDPNALYICWKSNFRKINKQTQGAPPPHSDGPKYPGFCTLTLQSTYFHWVKLIVKTTFRLSFWDLLNSWMATRGRTHCQKRRAECLSIGFQNKAISA